MKKITALLLAALMLFALAAGCSSETGGNGSEGGQQQQPQNNNQPSGGEQGGENANKRTDITFANSYMIPDFDPVNWYMGTQSQIFQNVYSTLVDTVVADDLSLSYRPNLAKSWETEKDGTVWVFHLNEKAVYSDGSAVTAEHVKNCFERHFTNPYTMSYVEMIDSIEVRDEHTVAFNLKSAWASAPGCWYMVAIFNPELYDADKEAYIKNPVGSGPYTLDSIDEATGTYTLKRKSEWWGDKLPQIETVRIRTITDMSTMVISLQSGEIDFISNVQGANITLVKDDSKLAMKEGISQVGPQLVLNPNSEPLSNKTLRQAIAYALNYQALENAISSGYVSSKSSTVKFAGLDMELPDGLEKYSYNVEKAKELIAQSGLQTPINIGELYGGNANGSAEIVKQCLAEVGIECEIVQLEGNTMSQAVMSGNFTACIITHSGYVSAAENLRCLYGTGQLYNFSHFSNARVDELAEIAMTTQDRAEYERVIKEAYEIIVDESTAIGLCVPAAYAVGAKDLHFDPIWSGIDLITAYWE